MLAIKVKNEVERTELKLGGDLEQMKAQLGREKEMRIKFEQEVADYESKTATQLANREAEIAALREKFLESLKEKIGLLTGESDKLNKTIQQNERNKLEQDRQKQHSENVIRRFEDELSYVKRRFDVLQE